MSGRTRGVVANVVRERLLRTGAKVWITQPWTGGGLERLQVRGMSKGGRIIQKWVAEKALEGFRYATVPPHLEGDGYAIRSGRPATWTEPEEPPRWAVLLVDPLAAKVQRFLDETEAATGKRPTKVLTGRFSTLATDPATRAVWERAGVEIVVDDQKPHPSASRIGWSHTRLHYTPAGDD